MQTLKELREKINHLEDERARLSAEVEDLRKAAEARVAALEGEVSQLRKDVNSLREFLRP
jgi:predicted  nucleic acid-binding Zn-ribbon protein